MFRVFTQDNYFVWLNDKGWIPVKQYGMMSGEIRGKTQDYERFNKKDLRLL